jgi:hypothetical protein
MSLGGSLEHVRAVDIIQFVYIGKRTGTLRIRGPSHEARIGFHNGNIINAWLTESPKLGELLVLSGLIAPTTLTEALAIQGRENPPRPIGRILIGQGLVNEADIKQLLAEQFGRRVQEMLSWSRGEFEFVLDELWPLEELGAPLDDTVARLELDTQAVLLEALSHLEDLKRQEHETTTKRGDSNSPEAEFADDTADTRADDPRIRRQSAAAMEAVANAPGALGAGLREIVGVPAAGTGPVHPRIQVVTKDAELADRLAGLLQGEKARVTAVPARDAGFSLPGEPPPIVVLDLRASASGVDSVRMLRRTRPKAPVVAYCLPQTSPADIYEAGAAALVHGDELALTACVRRVFQRAIELSTESLVKESLRDGFARLRRIVVDLRSGVLGTTVPLGLMNVLAESIERAVLFVVEEDQLLAIGSFGVVAHGKELAAVAGRLQLSLRDQSVFVECAETDRPRVASYDETTLPAPFRAVVSRPASGLFTVFPISGSQRVIAMIYADNGNREHPVPDVELLGLAVAQLGLALENEILRRARDAHRRPARPAQPPPG